MDLSQANHFEHICEELFSSIKNESYGIEDDQTLSVHVWFKFQWTRDLVCWFVPSSEAFSGSGMCEEGLAGDDAPCTVCPSIDDNPEMPVTIDQKDSKEGAEGAGSCAYACKAQAPARVDVPTAPMILKYTIQHERGHTPAVSLPLPCSISPAKCRKETCAVLQVVLLAVHHLSVVLEVHAETSLWPSRIPLMSSVCRTGDCRPAPVMRCTSA